MPKKAKATEEKALSASSPQDCGLFLERQPTKEELLDAVSRIDRSNPVNALISVYYVCVNPAIKFSSPFIRKDAQRLIDRFGEEKSWSLAVLTVGLRSKDFFPTVNSPSDLWRKLPSVMSALQRLREDTSRGNRIEVGDGSF